MFNWCSVDEKRVQEVLNILKFKEDRACEDAMCCFLKKKFSKDSGLGLNKSMGLFQEHESETGYYRGIHYACKHLRLNVEKNKIWFDCKIYNNRCMECKEYPDGENYKKKFGKNSKCIAQAVSAEREKDLAKTWDMYFLERGNHNLGNFIVGSFTNLLTPFRKYDIIPVPNNLKNVLNKGE